MNRRLRRIVRLLAFIWAGFSVALEPPKNAKEAGPTWSEWWANRAKPGARLTIALDTTYVVKFVRSDGAPDYLAAVNALDPAPPEENALVPILRATGPSAFRKYEIDELRNRLKMGLWPVKGPYLTFLPVFAETRNPERPQSEVEAAMARCLAAPWTEKNEPLIAEWLRMNSAPLAAVAEGLKRPRFRIPYLSKADPPSLLETSLLVVGEMRTIAQMFLLKGMNRIAEGDLDAAAIELDRLHLLGRLVAAGPKSIIELLVGLQVDQVAFNGEIALARSWKWPPAALRARAAKLFPRRELADPAACFQEFERMSILCSLVNILVHKQLPPGTDQKLGVQLSSSLYNVDEVLRTTNRRFDGLAAAFRKPPGDERTAALKQIHTEFLAQRAAIVDRGGDWWNSNSPLTAPGELRTRVSQRLAVRMLDLLLPAYYLLDNAIERNRSRRRIEVLAYLLAAHKLEHGAYPARLNLLRAGEFPELLTDPNFRKPYIYRIDGSACEICSKENVDTPGVVIRPTPSRGDLVVRLP